jgi:mandelate racemase
VSDPLTIRSVDAMLVMVPMRRALSTSAMRIPEAPLVLIDLHTDEGITGHAYLFCYLESAGHAVVALARDVSAVLAGTEVSPAAVRRELGARFKLLGARGLVSAALAGVDVACWMRCRSRPGCRWPGCSAPSCGRRRPTTATDSVCWSRGPPPPRHRNWSPRASGPSRCGSAARRGTTTWPPSGRCAAIGPDVVLISDYNQALSANAARERCRQLDDEGLAWIEERFATTITPPAPNWPPCCAPRCRSARTSPARAPWPPRWRTMPAIS